jgi:hypothetical protein
VPARPQPGSKISALLAGRARRRPAQVSLVCPACGESLTAADHAVQLAGNPYHAGCVLYQPRLGAGRSS